MEIKQINGQVAIIVDNPDEFCEEYKRSIINTLLKEREKWIDEYRSIRQLIFVLTSVFAPLSVIAFSTIGNMEENFVKSHNIIIESEIGNKIENYSEQIYSLSLQEERERLAQGAILTNETRLHRQRVAESLFHIYKKLSQLSDTVKAYEASMNENSIRSIIFNGEKELALYKIMMIFTVSVYVFLFFHYLRARLTVSSTENLLQKLKYYDIPYVEGTDLRFLKDESILKFYFKVFVGGIRNSSK